MIKMIENYDALFEEPSTVHETVSEDDIFDQMKEADEEEAKRRFAAISMAFDSRDSLNLHSSHLNQIN